MTTQHSRSPPGTRALRPQKYQTHFFPPPGLERAAHSYNDIPLCERRGFLLGFLEKPQRTLKIFQQFRDLVAPGFELPWHFEWGHAAVDFAAQWGAMEASRMAFGHGEPSIPHDPVVQDFLTEWSLAMSVKWQVLYGGKRWREAVMRDLSSVLQEDARHRDRFEWDGNSIHSVIRGVLAESGIEQELAQGREGLRTVGEWVLERMVDAYAARLSTENWVRNELSFRKEIDVGGGIVPREGYLFQRLPTARWMEAGTVYGFREGEGFSALFVFSCGDIYSLGESVLRERGEVVQKISQSPPPPTGPSRLSVSA